MIEPIFEYKIRKRGIACHQAPPRERKKSKWYTNERRLYNHVIMKYNCLSPFLNPKSEKWG